jgi:membrane-associated phospholipid phosphatase
MKTLLRENGLYLSLVFLFILGCGILLLFIETGDAILFFSERRTTFWDWFFRFGTQLGEEFAYLITGILALMVRYRYGILVAATGFFVTLISFASKMFFAHDRPSVFFRKIHALDDINLVEGVDLHVGATSFPSGHTMSGFALFTLLALLSHYKRFLPLVYFAIALIVGLSRIYLVQHFLKDVFMGALMGTLLGIGLYWLQKQVSFSPKYWFNRTLAPPQYHFWKEHRRHDYTSS